MKYRNMIGICLIILGIAICSTGIGVHIVYLHEKYLTFPAFEYFDSFAQYYWTVGKANLAASVIGGLLPIGIGLYLLNTKPWWYCTY